MQLFADDTSLFSIVYDPNTSANELNKDLQKISEWACQWEMSSNPDQNKQAQKVIFSRKITKSSLPQISFNNMPVFSVNFQKHLGIYLDEKLNFNYHIKEKICKAMQGVGVIRKLSKILPRNISLQNISHLLDRILTMVMYLMINQTMQVYARKLKVFSTMPLISSQVRSKVHLR